jgi:hypothetical protein
VFEHPHHASFLLNGLTFPESPRWSDGRLWVFDTFTSHDLRRMFASMLAEMGVALDLVATIVGHESGGKDTRTLVRHYARTDLLKRKTHALRGWDEIAKGGGFVRKELEAELT